MSQGEQHKAQGLQSSRHRSTNNPHANCVPPVSSFTHSFVAIRWNSVQYSPHGSNTRKLLKSTQLMAVCFWRHRFKLWQPNEGTRRCPESAVFHKHRRIPNVQSSILWKKWFLIGLASHVGVHTPVTLHTLAVALARMTCEVATYVRSLHPIFHQLQPPWRLLSIHFGKRRRKSTFGTLMLWAKIPHINNEPKSAAAQLYHLVISPALLASPRTAASCLQIHCRKLIGEWTVSDFVTNLFFDQQCLAHTKFNPQKTNNWHQVGLEERHKMKWFQLEMANELNKIKHKNRS